MAENIVRPIWFGEMRLIFPHELLLGPAQVDLTMQSDRTQPTHVYSFYLSDLNRIFWARFTLCIKYVPCVMRFKKTYTNDILEDALNLTDQFFGELPDMYQKVYCCQNCRIHVNRSESVRLFCSMCGGALAFQSKFLVATYRYYRPQVTVVKIESEINGLGASVWINNFIHALDGPGAAVPDMFVNLNGNIFQMNGIQLPVANARTLGGI